MKQRQRWLLPALAAVVLSVVALLPATPALAAAPCSGTSCNGKSWQDPTLTGCAPYSSYGGGENGVARFTVRYSKTCHAVYVEMDYLGTPPTNVPDAVLFFSQPQYGGREQRILGDRVDRIVYSRLVSWDYSVKGCYLYNYAVAIRDPGDSATGSDMCTRWF